MKPSRNVTLFIAALALACFVLIAGTSINPSALAGPVSNQLKPPFKFEKTATVGTNDINFPPPGSSIIFTETFGTSFAPTTTLGTTPAWRVITNTGASNYYWGDVISGTFAPSAWPAAAQIAPGVGITYPANLNTWLVYGPLDLSHYASAYLAFNYYLDSTPGACYPTYSGDCLSWAYSFDGINFTGSDTSGHISPVLSGTQWLTGSLMLNNANFKASTLYLAFAFNSGNLPSGVGAFIRNVVVMGYPIKFSYMPVVFKNYAPSPTPTATPIPPLFGYTFDDSGANLSHWGGAFYNTGSTKYGQCVTGQCTIHTTIPHGNPGNSLRLYTNGFYSFIASSPNDITPNDFDLYVDISPWIIYPRDAGCVLYGCPSTDLGDWYGIIFNASSDTFGANPSQFAYNKEYYRLYFYNVDAAKPIKAKLERCDGSSDPANNACTSLGKSDMPSNFIGDAGGFDTIHIVRLASGPIQVWLDGNLIITANDSSYTGSSYGKYGTFIFSEDDNATQDPVGYEMQVDFDNINVYSH